jgi:hypothetical protein
MNVFIVLSILLLLAVIVLGVIVYKDKTCSNTGYSRCYLTDDSSTCISDTVKTFLDNNGGGDICNSKR